MKVISSVLVTKGDEIVIHCTMDNNSLWETDLEGNEWRQIKMSDNDLTHAFDAWNGEPEK